LVTRSLGNWTAPSGNRCDATLTVDRAGDSVGISFSWTSPPSPEDRDFHYEALTEAMEAAAKALLQRRVAFEACFDMWAAGIVVPAAEAEAAFRKSATAGGPA